MEARRDGGDLTDGKISRVSDSGSLSGHGHGGAFQGDIVLLIDDDATGRRRTRERIATWGGITLSAPDTLAVLGNADGPVVVVEVVAGDAGALVSHGAAGATSDRVVTGISGGTVVRDGSAHGSGAKHTVTVNSRADGVTGGGLIAIVTDKVTRLTKLLAGATELGVLNSADLSAEVGDQFTTRGGKEGTFGATSGHVGPASRVVGLVSGGISRAASHVNTGLSHVGSGAASISVLGREHGAVVGLDLAFRGIAVLIHPLTGTGTVLGVVCDARHLTAVGDGLETKLAVQNMLGAQSTVGYLSLQVQGGDGSLAVVRDLDALGLEGPDTGASLRETAGRIDLAVNDLGGVTGRTSVRASLLEFA
jgi:hypothetical protein